MNLKQDQTVYFNLGENKPQGWAAVSGVQGFVVIIKPLEPLPDYPFTHLYVVDSQIVKPPNEVKLPVDFVVTKSAPVVPQEDLEDYPFQTGHEAPPNGQQTF